MAPLERRLALNVVAERERCWLPVHVASEDGSHLAPADHVATPITRPQLGWPRRNVTCLVAETVVERLGRSLSYALELEEELGCAPRRVPIRLK